MRAEQAELRFGAPQHPDCRMGLAEPRRNPGDQRLVDQHGIEIHRRLAGAAHEAATSGSNLALTNSSPTKADAGRQAQHRVKAETESKPCAGSRSLLRVCQSGAASMRARLSPSFFRKLVAEKRMPRPRLAGGRRVWDVAELDIAFKLLPREGGDDEPIFDAGGQGMKSNPWDDLPVAGLLRPLENYRSMKIRDA
jgi:hypothetical protein